MLTSLLKKFGYIRQEPGHVLLSIDEAEVIAEALQIYHERLPTQRYGYFAETAQSAKDKIGQIRPGLFARFMQP